MSKINFLNVRLDNLTMEEAIEKIDYLINNKRKSYVVTPNVDHLIRLESDVEFRNAYDNADLVLTDGKPLIWIANLLKTPIKEKVSGSDLFPEICKLASVKDYSIFILGAAEGVAEKAIKSLTNRYKGVKFCGFYSPPFGFENSQDEVYKILKLINNKKPDILAVALGTPKQEKFIYKNIEQLDIGVALNIGATIDFEAGVVRRAPKWMQNCGLEWFYRLCKEPKRMFKRYIIDDMKILKLVYRYIK